MAYIQDGRAVAGYSAVETKTRALRVTDAPRGLGFSVAGTSGIIAAAQAAGNLFWAIRNGTTNPDLITFIERIRFQVTVTAAFTTAFTSGRRLSFFRGSAAAPTGGLALGPFQKNSTSVASQISSASGGDARIATTTGLGIASIVWEANPVREFSMLHMNAAGANNEDVYDFDATSPIMLQPGQLLGLRCPQAMDAGGTFVVNIDCDYHESVSWDSQKAD